jgi:hypothetical protein
VRADAKLQPDSSSAPNELIVSLHLPEHPEQTLNHVEAERQLTHEAREKLLAWLHEQNSEFEIFPDSNDQRILPIFLIRTNVNSLVEKLLDEPSRPKFIRGAEFKQQNRFSFPQPEESFE